MEDDLEECWASIMPPPRPRPPPPSGIERGYLWMGLLDVDGREPLGMCYERQRVVVTSNETMEFEAHFPDTLTLTAAGIALYPCQQGGEHLWKKLTDVIHVRPGTVLGMRLTVNDVSGEMGEQCGFRKVLRLMGVL